MLVAWLAGWLARWLVGWLVGWLGHTHSVCCVCLFEQTRTTTGLLVASQPTKKCFVSVQKQTDGTRVFHSTYHIHTHMTHATSRGVCRYTVAAFLMTAGNQSFFASSTCWVDPCTTWHSEFYDRPLGSPLGPGQQVSASEWHRQFEHVNVTLDCTARTATIEGWNVTTTATSSSSSSSSITPTTL